MDDALRDSFLYDRLEQAYLEHDRLIIAYDLDDTVRPYKSENCDMMKDLLRRAKQLIDPYFIVYTANPNLGKNIKFLTDNELPWDNINDDMPETDRGYDELKLYYNLFFDDKAGIAEAYYALSRLLDNIENGKIRKDDSNG